MRGCLVQSFLLEERAGILCCNASFLDRGMVDSTVMPEDLNSGTYTTASVQAKRAV